MLCGERMLGGGDDTSSFSGDLQPFLICVERSSCEGLLPSALPPRLPLSACFLSSSSSSSFASKSSISRLIFCSASALPLRGIFVPPEILA